MSLEKKQKPIKLSSLETQTLIIISLFLLLSHLLPLITAASDTQSRGSYKPTKYRIVSAHPNPNRQPSELYKKQQRQKQLQKQLQQPQNQKQQHQKKEKKKNSSTTDEEFLLEHNKVRSKEGEPPLKWDKKLASFARDWAKKRDKDCSIIHSNGPYGENIFWGSSTRWRPKDAVKMWADEYKYYDKKANSCEGGKMCGHYTQIVWRDSAKVGCAHVECSNGGVFVICVYDPPGNYEGENPFEPYVEPGKGNVQPLPRKNS